MRRWTKGRMAQDLVAAEDDILHENAEEAMSYPSDMMQWVTCNYANEPELWKLEDRGISRNRCRLNI